MNIAIIAFDDSEPTQEINEGQWCTFLVFDFVSNAVASQVNGHSNFRCTSAAASRLFDDDDNDNNDDGAVGRIGCFSAGDDDAVSFFARAVSSSEPMHNVSKDA
mmetsp:Transcript_75631/g.151991  ORF Transcript_75631/g.151991 Transcript_75631/m.151991 type:complete len:104 (-) Transcript_75631:10-321(-)